MIGMPQSENINKNLRDGGTAVGVSQIALLLRDFGLSAAMVGVVAAVIATIYAFAYRYGRKILRSYVQKRWPSLLEEN